MTQTHSSDIQKICFKICFYEHLRLNNIFVVLSRETGSSVVVVVKCFVLNSISVCPISTVKGTNS